jgi:hypothetical protein
MEAVLMNFLDANVLFSAAWLAGSGLMRLLEADALHLVVSSYPAVEAERNLFRKRPEGVARLHALMDKVEVSGALGFLHTGHGLPDKDIPILAAAIASHCPILHAYPVDGT